MKRIKDHFKNIHNDEAITLTFGNFDGIHLGHQALIKQTRTYDDTQSAVMTFDPHPFEVLRNRPHTHLMNTLDKMEHIEALGVDKLFCIMFDQEFSELTSEAFIDFLKSIHVKRIVLGQDARFGKNGQGRISDLKPHFEITVIPDTLFNHTRVSSSFIKQIISEGDMDFASKLLSKPYRVYGQVCHGNHLGRTLGFPTTNIDYQHFHIPKLGVYAVKIKTLGQWFYGMANIGHNPTINYQSHARLEVYIFDFNADIYGKHVMIDFYAYIREEQKFDSKESLVTQLKNDEKTVRDFFKIKDMI
jgi:riboflavin kinase/FMN adenylyltransferase